MVSVTRRLVPVLFLLLVVASPCAYAQRGATADPVAPTYMGRVIAQTMHYTGAEWLVRDNRELEERSSLVVANLGVKSGMTVCDMGCGNGYYTLKLAELAGREGRVLAVDIQPEMLRLLELRTKELGVTNVRPVLGTVQDPGLPDGEVDLIFCVDVYHEFSQPEEMLAAMRRATQAGWTLGAGRVPRRGSRRAHQAAAQDEQGANHRKSCSPTVIGSSRNTTGCRGNI